MRTLPWTNPGQPATPGASGLLGFTARGQARTIGAGMVWGGAWMASIGLQPWALGHGLDRIAEHRSVLGWSLVLAALCGAAAFSGIMRHRAAVTNFLAATCRSQQLLARKAASLGRATRGAVTGGEMAVLADADAERMGAVFDVTARFTGSLVSSTLVLALLFTQSTVVGLFVTVGLPITLASAAPLVKPLERRDRFSRSQLARTSRLAADTVLGLRVLKGVGGEAQLRDRFLASSQELRTAATRTAVLESVLDTLQVVLPGLFTVGVAWLAARQAVEGRITPGGLLSCYAYTAFLVLPLRTVTEFASRLASGRVSAGRIAAVLDRVVRARTRRLAATAPLRLVDEPTELSVPPGSFVCVASSDPSELTELALRLAGYAGGASADGAPLDEVDARGRILLSEKENQLLAGSLRDTLTPPGATVDAEVALEVAAAADVHDTLGGLDGVLDERGRNLSGGQRQRVALARAVAVSPDVLVLDEPTSAVDTHTEARIATRLSNARRGRTTIVMTTSPPLLDIADECVFLSDGRVLARGRHAELMRSCPPYRRCVTREIEHS